jgi:hypothetical protein
LSIKEELNRENISISTASVAKLLKSMNYTRKRLSIVPIERNSTRTLDIRQEYCRFLNNVSDENLIFLDETGFNLTKKNIMAIRSRIQSVL